MDPPIQTLYTAYISAYAYAFVETIVDEAKESGILTRFRLNKVSHFFLTYKTSISIKPHTQLRKVHCTWIELLLETYNCFQALSVH